ncbi:MAG: outer membrane beta-barrel protein [Muribaculaceae bacterium]|nr:outer membrane beta-barrel protein [Muribaculaceae bacterium]
MSDTYGTPISVYTYTKHYKPVTLGASVRVPIGGRWSITSGLTYSRLKSKTTIQDTYQEQVLHYVGVPLGAIYSIWSYKHFNVYATGGIQADFNVKATLKKNTLLDVTSIGKDRVQFSALAGPGLQFDLLQSLGIYFEPTVRYYFDNGSGVDNYFKDKPWNINLNAGLRLSL